MTWSITVTDLHDERHTMVSADMPGVSCEDCGRVARATLGLSSALCDHCCAAHLQLGVVDGSRFAIRSASE
jgi:hypothetical protein